MSPLPITLRPATPNDETFVDEMTRATMMPYVRKTWSKGDLVAEYFKSHPYDPANTHIIQLEGKDVGRVTLLKTSTDVTIDGIHVLPEYQSKGIGGQVMQTIIDENNEKGLTTKLLVLKVNPAIELYERLGFEIVKETSSRFHMELSPTANAVVSISINADAAKVFDAFLDTRQIGDWMFGPKLREEEILELTIDPKVGGEFCFAVERGGDRIDHVGTYLEIDRPRRLVFTWGVKQDDSSSRIVVTLQPEGEGCELTLIHEMHPDWASFVDRAAESWRKMLTVLKHGAESA